MATKRQPGIMPEPFSLGLQMQQTGAFDGLAQNNPIPEGQGTIPGGWGPGPPQGFGEPDLGGNLWDQPFQSPYTQADPGRFAPPNFGLPPQQQGNPFMQGMMPQQQQTGGQGPMPPDGSGWQDPGPQWLKPGETEKHPLWNKFARWSQSQEGKDSMLAGAIFGLSFTDPQKALELATRLREAKNQRIYQSEQNQLQRDAMKERAQMSAETGKQNKLQSRIQAVLGKAMSSSNAVDAAGWIQQNAPEGLDEATLPAFEVWMTSEKARQEQLDKTEKLAGVYRKEVAKGTLTQETASRKFPDLAGEFDTITKIRKDTLAFKHTIDMARLEKTRATTKLTQSLTPDKKQAIDTAKVNIQAIDSQIDEFYGTISDYDKLINYAIVNEIDPIAARDLLKGKIEELLDARKDLETSAYGQAGGVGANPGGSVTKSPGDTTPKPAGVSVDPGEFLRDNPELEDLIKRNPGSKFLPGKVQPPPKPPMSEAEKARRVKLGLPVPK